MSVAIVSLALILTGPAAAGDAKSPPLGRYGVEAQPLTVSGLSSGGYMAVQLAVAYSSVFSGVGVIAAGPYGCAFTGVAASANINRALGPCMSGGYGWIQKWQCAFFIASCPGPDRPDSAASVLIARQLADRQAIDPLTNIMRQRVYLLSGRKDTTVVPAVVDALEHFYAKLAAPANIQYDRLDDAAHTFPTEGFSDGNTCSRSVSPFVSDCKYDAAGKLLEHIHGPLKARNQGGLTGTLVQFDQVPFFPPGADPGLNAIGYVYVPKSCNEKGARCTLHVALHGCQQTPGHIGTRFVEGTGYNRWADTNAIIVLYPQVRTAASGFERNPESCWDWWGYSGPVWLEKRAPQMRAIMAMVDHLRFRP
jgi:hypothetical protein